jgi:hypothetical protein
MIEACGVDERLRDFARELRKETRGRLAASLTRARQARDIRHPALDADTAAWAALLLGDAAIDPSGVDEIRKVIEVLVFAARDDVKRVRA